MINYFKKNVIRFFDTTNTELSTVVNVLVGLITFFTIKSLGIGGMVSLLICVTVVLLLGSMVQLFRKDKNIRVTLFYIIGTLFCTFSTIVVWNLNKYSKTNNVAMVANMIKISICVIAILFDILGGFYIVNNDNLKGKKIILLVCMIYFTLIAVGAILFFSSKGV